jgi:hypothetical protein
MPISKRYIPNPNSFGRVSNDENQASSHLNSSTGSGNPSPSLLPIVVNESSADDQRITSFLGCLHQLSYLSYYAFEMMDSLSCMSKDVLERINSSQDRYRDSYRIFFSLILSHLL